MYKEMLAYKNDLLAQLADEKCTDTHFWQRAYKFHLSQLKTFNTERLIHLIIMLFVGLYMVIFFCAALAVNSLVLMFLALTTLVLFVAYVVYYFKLENTVQALIRLTPAIASKIEESKESSLATFKLPPIVDMVVDKISNFVADFLAHKR